MSWDKMSRDKMSPDLWDAGMTHWHRNPNQQDKNYIWKTITLLWTPHMTISKHHKLSTKAVKIWFQPQGIIVQYLATCIHARWLWHGFRNLSPWTGYMQTWFWSGSRDLWSCWRWALGSISYATFEFSISVIYRSSLCITQIPGEYRINCISWLVLSISIR